MSDIVVWNNARAQEIRIRSVKALQGTADEMLRVAADFRRQRPPLIERRRLIGRQIQDIHTQIARRGTPETPSESRSIERLETQISDLDRNIAELDRSIEILERAAGEVGNKITETNNRMADLFEELRRIDGHCADRVQYLKDRIIQYTNLKILSRDNFINYYFPDTVFVFPTIHNTSVFSKSKEDIARFVEVGLDVIDASCEDTFNALKTTMSSLPLADRISILEIVLAAPPFYQAMFFAVAPYIDIASINAVNVPIRPDGQGGEYIRESEITGIGFIQRTDGTSTIHFNVNRDRDNNRGSFFDFFHEVGHLIDWVAAGSDNNLSFSRTADGFYTQLFEALHADVEAMLRQVVQEMSLAHISENNRELYMNRAIENIMNGQPVVLGPGQRRVNLSHAQRLQYDLQNEMNQILQGYSDTNRTEHNMVIPSDIFGGVTNNAVRGRIAQTIDYYWFDQDGNNRFRQGSELFAHYYAASMLNDPNRQSGTNAQNAQRLLHNFSTFFPGASSGVFRDLVNGIHEGVVPQEEAYEN